jgi:hypothetical protein
MNDKCLFPSPDLKKETTAFTTNSNTGSNFHHHLYFTAYKYWASSIEI